MEITITFPGGARVDAQLDQHIVHTDQPISGGGDDSAVSPFGLFLASIGTCAGIYVLGFCRQRNLSTEGMRIVQTVDRDPQTGLVGHIGLEIIVPAGFPPEYHAALIRTAELCAVKKHLEHPPAIDVTVKA